MTTDFLSSLSSRVFQTPEADVTGSGLKPRLASRFENLNTQGVPASDPAPDAESFVEGRGDAGLRTPAPSQDRTPFVQNHPISNDGLQPGALTVPERRPEESKYFFEKYVKSAVPHALKPIPAAEHSNMPPRKPAQAERAELPSPARKNEMIQQPTISPISAAVSPRAEPDKVIEIHTNIVGVQPPSTDPEKAISASALPAAVPSSQPKVVPERIDVTRNEQNPQPAVNASQIIPSLELPEFKPQSRMPEAQEQPPTIHVTIGRIEVKAAPSAAAPKRGVPASATMSLDEYLRRRSGGDR
jgi:hypothetical protein